MQDWLAEAARKRPQHTAIAAGGAELSYEELDERVALRARDLAPGELVAIDEPPGLEFAERLHACWRAGAVAMPLAPGAAAAPARQAPAPGTALVIQTSGTSGEPKRVELSFENLEASAAASADALGVDPDDRWLCPLPLHHVGGLSVLVRCAINATTALVHPRFDTERVKKEFEAGGATLASLVPTMLARLRHAGLRRTPGLRAIALGGGPAPPGLLDWAARTGIPVVPVYGLTESASQIVAGVPGRPLRGVELRIGRDGELLVRGAMVARQSRDADGWLHTGDAGHLDADGRLHLSGRLKELIVTGGENVAPAEVEAVLGEHPAVADAGVVGLADPEWSEAVTAFVVLRAPAGPEELRHFCRERLDRHKVPKQIHVVHELPRNAAGKLLRDRLAQMAPLESPPS
ncbi:MAG TPA: AMP-binding protein [Thermoleophilaceae bacterium]|nr:AMP-binding protein [Thermoleophilaceae bacterium]